MCAILGATLNNATPLRVKLLNETLAYMVERSFERGRDGRGYGTINNHNPHGELQVNRENSWKPQGEFIRDSDGPVHTLIANFRAEPTTEYVEKKVHHDQQPYRAGPWAIVHNGTIANDKELRTGELSTTIDSAAIAEVLNSFPTYGIPLSAISEHFAKCINKLKGSYAILAMHDDHPGTVFSAANYRPIWMAYNRSTETRLFASSRDYFPDTYEPTMLPPYSAWAFTPKGAVQLRAQPEFAVRPGKRKPHALVVCSGGMDSVVAATMMLAEGYSVTLVHFRYGSRAEGPEVKAIQEVASYLGVGYWMPSMDIYQPTDSPLLQVDSEIAGGEEGAEFAHEWVPARNLVMLSIATAMAEAKGFDYIVLGNNLEEAGAYPDNEPEFIHRFNDLLPFAVGDGKRVRVLMPVGNMMKHEIVAKGLEIGAPLHLTWSCYRAGERHCGTCGPCHMRKTAFRINQQPEVIEYERN